jgi:aldehyde dehydrogenase (NAD+)
MRVKILLRRLIRDSDEAEIASVEAAGEEDVNDAVIAARAALNDPTWRDLSPTDRGNLMIKLADLIEANKELLATIDAWDNGSSPDRPHKSS